MPLVSCGKKNLSILKPVEVLSSPLLMWLFQCVETLKKKRTHRAPFWPPSLWNKTKKNTPLGRDLSRAKFQEVPFLHLRSALTPFDKSLGNGKERHGWVKWCEAALCVSHGAGASPGHICRQVSYSSSLFCHSRECASRLSCLLNQFPMQRTLHPRNFQTLCAADIICHQWKFKLWSYQAVSYSSLHVHFWEIPTSAAKII